MTASAVRDAASDALLNALRPLSSIALEAGLSIEDVYQLLRLAAVSQLALRESGKAKPPSISGISAVTGIPRAEVSKLLKRTEPSIKPNRINERITNSILVAWREDARFTTAEGQPASLIMYGRGRSFERLAKLHGRGIPARALLDELKRTRSISVGPDQIVHHNAGVAIDRGITAEGIRAVGEHVSELVNSLFHNMKNPGVARLISRVSSKKVASEELPLLRREVAKMTEQYLGELQELFSRSSNVFAGSSVQTALSVTTYCSESPTPTMASGESKRKNYRRKP